MPLLRQGTHPCNGTVLRGGAHCSTYVSNGVGSSSASVKAMQPPSLPVPCDWCHKPAVLSELRAGSVVRWLCAACYERALHTLAVFRP